MKVLDERTFPRKIFVDLQRAFKAADYGILIHKLNLYAIRRVADHWLSSYLQNRFHNLTINSFNFKILF